MKRRKETELLAPAKNCAIGMDAILSGADAVYIGAPKFGARAAAGNSTEEIAELVRFAHSYRAKVYVTLNTILYDQELKEAEEMIGELYRIGVDALIIQDLGILKMNIPPIALHASTQMDVRSAEKAEWLRQMGISRVVLARELSVAQIEEIASRTKVELEVFIHGALCNSISGQCYISQAECGRSANRGECAQYCRLPYELLNSHHQPLPAHRYPRHWLSTRDLNRTDELERLIRCGVVSFKIEGRLKESDYVRTVVAHYDTEINRLLALPSFGENHTRSSIGQAERGFTPIIEKVFNRGFTSLQQVGNTLSLDTPKSIGEKIGTVKEIGRDSFTVAGLIALNNNDGLCFLDEEGQMQGIKVNRVEGNRVFPLRMPKLRPKTELWRSYDHRYSVQIDKSVLRRTIPVIITLDELPFGFALSMTDEKGAEVRASWSINHEEARSAQQDHIARQLGKLGDTEFRLLRFEYNCTKEWFIPSSILAGWRREIVEKLRMAYRLTTQTELRRPLQKVPAYFESVPSLSYLANVANHLAQEVYEEAGIKNIAPAFEVRPPAEEQTPLMFSRHCIRQAIGACTREHKKVDEEDLPRYLRYKGKVFELEFDCRACQMILKRVPTSNICR